jgi:D-alanyl-D-alanine carboxypeptidase/D-alanyl-D-alanine-endopeptidase (penicillin-binding protein 4)
MRFFLFILFIDFSHAYSQIISQKLLTAVKKMEADSQMQHAIMGFYVIDAKTGKQVFAHNAGIGLAAASTQKLFTSGAAFELLGPNFKYRTQLGYSGKIENGILKGHLIIVGSCDPTLGSWRFNDTNEDTIINSWIRAIKQNGINKITGSITRTNEYKLAANGDRLKWDLATIPDGWIWQDIGNYYGAGADLVNWRENQYDLILHPSDPGLPVVIDSTKPKMYGILLISQLTTGEKNSGDNAYIYLPPSSDLGFVRGTAPAGVKDFIISGSMPDPGYQLQSTIKERLQQEGIPVGTDTSKTVLDQSFYNPRIILSHFSPSLDTMNYWFLKKSINLYGEALIKAIGWMKAGNSSTEKGLQLVRDFWKQHGIDKASIHIMDGSGLSPQNRVTTEAEVKVLQYAKTCPWYNSFYNALPEMNGMKMKSGAIGGARAFAGYHTAKSGTEYIFSIIVNNYDGSSSEIVKKMYKLLDNLK